MPFVIVDNMPIKLVQWMDIVRAVAGQKGYVDVDLEPTASGFKATASGPNAPVTSYGKTREEACEALCRSLW